MTLGSGDQVGTDLPGTLSSKEKVKRIEIGEKRGSERAQDIC